MIAMPAPIPLPEARAILCLTAEYYAPSCRFDRVELGMADAVLMASAGAFAEERGELHSLARRCVRLSVAASGIVGDVLRFVAAVLFRAARGVS
jgi:hypothetical protein